MDVYGTNWSFFILQCLSLSFLVGWPLFSLATLAGLKNRRLQATAEAIWALVIVLVPLLGSAAFWIVSPRDKEV